jgi:hypothetical protein
MAIESHSIFSNKSFAQNVFSPFPHKEWWKDVFQIYVYIKKIQHQIQKQNFNPFSTNLK